MSISINYSSTIGLHGVDPVITSKNLIEWITSYNDITVTGKTNFNNDIQLSYDSLNFLNINIDENANTIFNITNVGNNNNLSTFIYNNKIQANNGISIKGDTIIGDSIDNSLFINSNIYINNNTIFNDVFFKDNIRIGGNLHITGTMNNPAISTNDITILGSNTNIGLTIDNTNTSNNSIINFKNNGNTIYSIGYSGSNQVFQICNSDFDSQPRITINSSGNVGIGTTNPNSKLHVKGNMKIKQEAQMNHTANDHDNALVFETPDSSHNYYIGYNYGGTFDIGYYDLTNYSRCLTMNPNFVATLGSVGIGTTNPSTKLHIYNSTVSNKIVENNVDLLIEDDNSRLQLISTDSGAGGSYIALSNALATPITTPSLIIHQKNWVFHHFGPNQDNKLGIYYRENGEDPNNNNISTESLYILSTTGLTLDTSGNVGIGTSNPEDKLDVSGDIRLTGEMYFDYPRIFTLGSRDATGGGSGTKLVLQAKTNGKEFQMRNQDDLSCFAFAMYNHDELPSPSGSSIFDVYSAKDVVSRIGYAFIGYPGVTGSAGFGHINMFGNDQKYALRQTGLGATVLNSYNNDLFFRINNSDKMLIDTSGNVGIGTTSPSSKLHIEDSTSAVAFTINNTNSSNDSIINFNNLGSTQYSIGYDSSLNTFQICDGNFSNSSIFRINSNKITVGSSNTSYDINNFNISGSFYFARQGSNFDYSNNNFGGTGPNIRIGDYMYLGHTRANNFPYIAFNGYLSSSTYVSGGTTYNRWRHKYHNGTDSKITLITANTSGSISIKTANTTGNEIEENGYETTSNFTNIVHIGNTGNIGIGTTNPTEKLTVNGSNINATPCLGLRNGMSGGDAGTYGAQIALGWNGTNQYQHFISTRHYGGQEAGNRIDFYTCNGTQQNTITSGTNLVMSLDGTNVGIGVTNPTENLEVYSGQVSSSILGKAHIGNVGHTTAAAFCHVSYAHQQKYSLIQGSDGETYLNAPTNKNVRFRINNQDKMFLSGAAATLGNLGIGTTDPQSKLHISSGTSGDCELILEADTDNNNENDNPRILFRQDSGNDWSMIGNNNNSLVLANSVGSGGGILFKTGATGVDRAYENATERMRIDSSGNVGIGTTSPSSILHISGNANVLRLEGSDHCFISFFPQGNTTRHAFIGVESLANINNLSFSNEASGDIIFRLGSNSEKMRILNNGNLGIGTTGPTERLDVNGNIKGTNFIGNVDGTLDNYDSTRFFRREGRTNAEAGSGWISVATCTSSRYAGEILVTDHEPGHHSYIRIHWMRSYSDSNFTVINCGGYRNRITGVRVLYQTGSDSNGNSYNTYGEKILQVYVTHYLEYHVSIFRMGDDPNYYTFTALTPVLENTKSGFDIHGNELTNLDTYGFAHEEGIQAGGNMKAGGDLHVVGNTYYDTSGGLRQMINLWNDDYGIGIQNSTTYFRTGNDFQFYKGGSHHDDIGNAGTNGTALLTIKNTGNVGIGTTSPTSRLHVNGDSRIDGTISYGSTNKTASLYIKGTGLNNAASRLVILSGVTIVNNSTIGLTLTIINGQTLQHVSSTNYDTYNSTTNSNNLATAINNMTHTQIGILTSYDSFTRLITSDLRTAAMRVGLTKLASVASNGQTNYTTREPYAAIFYGTSSDGDSTPQYIRDVIEIYRSNEDSDGTNLDESPPAIISTTLSSDGNYAGIAGASSVNALWAASPAIENPALICDRAGNLKLLHRNDSSVYNNFLTFERSSGDDCRINHYCNNQVSAQIDFNGYSQSAQGLIQFNTKESTGSLTTRMTVNYNGNVGIGTTNPTSSLHVVGPVDTNEAPLGVHIGTYNNSYSAIELISSSGLSSWIDFYNTGISGGSTDFSERIRGGAGQLEFYTNVNQRMTINSSGYVGIGTTNPTTPLDIVGTGPGAGSFNYRYIRNVNPTYTSTYTADYNYSLRTSGHIHVGGELHVSSDERIKYNFKDINDYEYLQKIKQLKPYTYNYINRFDRIEDIVIGFKAQEIKNIIPGSTSLVTNYIPNINKLCDILLKEPNLVIKINNINEYSLSVGNKLKLYEYSPDTTLETTKQSLNIKSINGVNITLDGYLTTSNTKIWIRGIGDCNVNTQGDINTDAIIIIPTNISSNLSIGDTFEIYESQPNEKEEQHELEITNIDGENVTLNGSLTTTINEIYVYGKEINDFHTLHYNRIIPVCVAGIQEIDRRVVSHFTGSHTCYPENDSLDYNNYIGLIVISTGSFKIKYNDNIFTGKQAIRIDYSTPQICLSSVDNQKSVLGVVSLVQDDTVLINSSGEGGIWVCNKNGNLENGDYITTCEVSGYGVKQTLNEEFLTRYTVAKITCNIDFNSVNDYDTRFLLPDGTQITEIEYNNKKSLGEIVYIACFVGCTYHCG